MGLEILALYFDDTDATQVPASQAFRAHEDIWTKERIGVNYPHLSRAEMHTQRIASNGRSVLNRVNPVIRGSANYPKRGLPFTALLRISPRSSAPLLERRFPKMARAEQIDSAILHL